MIGDNLFYVILIIFVENISDYKERAINRQSLIHHSLCKLAVYVFSAMFII